jgi:hypothetical protein
MKRPSRRAFLTALGASAVLFGLPSRATGAAGKSGISGRPLRFIGVYMPHGRAHELWQPRGDFDITFAGSTLAPFDDAASYGKSFRDRLLVLDGVDLAAGIAVGTTGHDAPRAIFTGSGADGKNASIEQFLAFERGLGAETLHASLTLGVGNEQSDIGANVSYARGGTPIPKWIDPSRTFHELFGGALGGGREQELARERRRGKSVLDAVRADLSRIHGAAPSSERAKLEQHAESLRELEKRLTFVPPACDAPEAPDPARFPKLRAYGGGEPYFDAITDLQVDLLARAMACDLTRFATLFLGDLTRTGLVADLPADVHGDVAHRYDSKRANHPGTPESWERLAKQNRYTHQKIARLLQRLDEASVLDDTVIYCSSDMGDPAMHSSRSVPTLVFGNAGGAFKPGRYLDFRGERGNGIPNNRVLVSICQAFGVPIERFGHSADAKIVTGALPELRG